MPSAEPHADYCILTMREDEFQAVLDRLQSLNLIAWAREPDTIRITVASDAVSWLRRG